MILNKHIIYVWGATLTSLSLAQWNELAGIVSFALASGYTLYKWYKEVKGKQ
jgi:hypothetical protein